MKRLRTEVDPFIVEVSLHGCTAATHDRQTRVPGSFDRLMENLRGLREAGQRLKLNSTLTLWNENELEAMYAIADSFGAEMQVDPTVTPRDDRDTSPLSIAPSSDGLRELVKVQAVRARKTGVAPPDRERSGHDCEIPSAPVKLCGAGSMPVAVDP